MGYQCHDYLKKIFLRYRRKGLFVIDSFPLSESFGNESCCLSMLPRKSLFVLKIHLHLIAFTPLGNSTRFQTQLDVIEFISSFMELYHKLDYLELVACENAFGSFSAPML